MATHARRGERARLVTMPDRGGSGTGRVMRASATSDGADDVPVVTRAARVLAPVPVIAGIVAIAIAASGPQVDISPRAGRLLPLAQAGGLGAADGALDIVPAALGAGGHRVVWARLRVTASTDSPAAWAPVPDRGWLPVP